MTYQTHMTLWGGRFGILYRFPKRGDGIPMHKHVGEVEYLRHHILCTLGSVRVHLDDESVDLAPGDELIDGKDYDSRLPHEIVALQDGSHVLNVLLYGRPVGYDKLGPDDLDGSVELRPLQRGIG